ncbi:hypothetical protein M413DRAFT_185612 [Hebeloma cylindrosporum]|uniref:Uncharacterized protein n=1 Tax=Hebeloma cylindrosporum TaxID=76867 RepID=A0A0C3BT44_HEBCY|nr:hypothetical protein M413DRAFT_185612 [Hebeloma cylindrosporum h7]
MGCSRRSVGSTGRGKCATLSKNVHARHRKEVLCFGKNINFSARLYQYLSSNVDTYNSPKGPHIQGNYTLEAICMSQPMCHVRRRRGGCCTVCKKEGEGGRDEGRLDKSRGRAMDSNANIYEKWRKRTSDGGGTVHASIECVCVNLLE